MTEKPYAFYDIKAEDYPFTVDFLNEDDEVVHTIHCEQPGVMEIPALRETHGQVRVQVTYPDGRIVISP